MRSNTHSLRRVLALTAIATALTASPALAAPIEPVGQPGDETPAEAYTVTGLESQSAPAPAPAADDGFDWGDAGIGATAIVALAAIGAGAAAAVGHRPRRRHGVA